mgnify:CR=1 FL=1
MPPYSQFLGYDKHPDDPKIGFIVNEEEAKLVRRIYKEFLRGKSPSAISRMLEAEGIKSPTGRDTWHASTVRSILTNEKYKGDAILQKTFCTDFLTKKMKVRYLNIMLKTAIRRLCQKKCLTLYSTNLKGANTAVIILPEHLAFRAEECAAVARVYLGPRFGIAIVNIDEPYGSAITNLRVRKNARHLIWMKKH